MSNGVIMSFMSIIRILSDHVINQIAAGEVIENPASVVKELVENAIDAGAEAIIIEERGGGLQFIRVIDDGVGMSPDDALLSLERHATSKIKKAEDLFTLKTMGFRGEALASIAAVSHLHLTTSNGQLGTEIFCEEGRILKTLPAARKRGTTFEVRSLFAHVPARKSFQKSSSLCALAILKIVTQLSLAYPSIHFELIQEDKTTLSAEQTTSLEKRIGQVLGDKFLKDSFSLSFADTDLKVTGILGSPLQTKLNRTGQYLFINQRAVSCPAMSFAIKDGYGMRIEKERHPLFCLYLELTPELIDVNVHPQKLQVRLREEKTLCDKVKKAVGHTLSRENFPQDLIKPPFKEAHSFLNEFQSFKEAEEPLFIFKDEGLPLKKSEVPLPIVIGIFRHFLLLEGGESFDGILIVDLYAAEMRILYDHLRYEENKESQSLLIPELFTFSHEESMQLVENIPQLESIGFGIRALSAKNFVVDALPPFLEPSSLRDLLEEISTIKEKQGELLKRVLQFRRKRSYDLQEALAIEEKLKRNSSPSFCPFGKPITRYLKTDDIEKFK